MTEAEWYCGRDFHAMLSHLHYLRYTLRRRATDPKVRLLGCQACRAISHLLRDESVRRAYRRVEQFAAGEVGEAELLAGVDDAWVGVAVSDNRWRLATADGPRLHARAEVWAATAVYAVCGGRTDPQVEHVGSGTVGQVIVAVDWALVCEAGPEGAAAAAAERQRQLGLFHELFGKPFRPAMFASAWRTSTAVALAKQMYESRDFGAMPILADALQDAGCTSDDILNHCRDAQQTHVRGCWVVDLVLGKK